MVYRKPNSCALPLLAVAVTVASLSACNSAPKSEGASTNTAQPTVPVEPPPPPEPASALGSASGTLRMVNFAQEKDF